MMAAGLLASKEARAKKWWHRTASRCATCLRTCPAHISALLSAHLSEHMSARMFRLCRQVLSREEMLQRSVRDLALAREHMREEEERAEQARTHARMHGRSHAWMGRGVDRRTAQDPHGRMDARAPQWEVGGDTVGGWRGHSGRLAGTQWEVGGDTLGGWWDADSREWG